MNTGLASEAEQFDWLAAQLAGASGKPVALFLHKPLFLHEPERSRTRGLRDPLRAGCRRAAASWRCWRSVDLRLVASGHVHQRRDFTYRRVRHVWAPSAGFVISDSARR